MTCHDEAVYVVVTIDVNNEIAAVAAVMRCRLCLQLLQLLALAALCKHRWKLAACGCRCGCGCCAELACGPASHVLLTDVGMTSMECD